MIRTKDPQLRTQLQRDAMIAMIKLSKRKLAAGEVANVTTRELTDELDRVGQVVGHTCGAMADRGLLQRKGRGCYRLTLAGIDAAKKECSLMSSRTLYQKDNERS